MPQQRAAAIEEKKRRDRGWIMFAGKGKPLVDGAAKITNTRHLLELTLTLTTLGFSAYAIWVLLTRMRWQ